MRCIQNDCQSVHAPLSPKTRHCGAMCQPRLTMTVVNDHLHSPGHGWAISRLVSSGLPVRTGRTRLNPAVPSMAVNSD